MLFEPQGKDEAFGVDMEQQGHSETKVEDGYFIQGVRNAQFYKAIKKTFTCKEVDIDGGYEFSVQGPARKEVQTLL